MRYRFATALFAITLALGWATAASARGGENISHSGAEKICQYHGGISGSGCVFCGPINCTVVTCKHSGECNVLVHKNAARVVGGRRTGQGLRPIRVGGAKASAIDGRSTGPTNPSGPDMPDRPKATSAYHGGATGGPHHH